MAAMEAFSEGPLVMILGGYDKGMPFDELGVRVTERCRGAVLVGATASSLAAAIGKGCPVVRADSMGEAVDAAARLLPGGGAVVLSPACASYDQFTNFEERGACFRATVKGENWPVQGVEGET
jgi:UDP-N-acetylmuramoylalanine--D-glutamate ligase